MLISRADLSRASKFYPAGRTTYPMGNGPKLEFSLMNEYATFLIPDISGYTDFLSRTEIIHSTHIVTELMEAMLAEVGERLELAEIEGDALLLYQKGKAMSLREVGKLSLSMYQAFHRYLKEIERDNVCHCGACMQASALNLKFIAHYGEIKELKVGRFVKPTGLDLIVAHRLLKNSVPKGEGYLLISEKLLTATGEALPELLDLCWEQGQDAYAALGKVAYHFSQLGAVRAHIPAPPPRPEPVTPPSTPWLSLDIEAPLEQVYQVLTDPKLIPVWGDPRAEITPEGPIERLGAGHVCQIEGEQIEFTNVQRKVTEQYTDYVNLLRMPQRDLTLYQYYRLYPETENRTKLTFSPVPVTGQAEEGKHGLEPILEMKKQEFALLKAYCEAQA